MSQPNASETDSIALRFTESRRLLAMILDVSEMAGAYKISGVYLDLYLSSNFCCILTDSKFLLFFTIESNFAISARH